MEAPADTENRWLPEGVAGLEGALATARAEATAVEEERVNDREPFAALKNQLGWRGVSGGNYGKGLKRWDIRCPVTAKVFGWGLQRRM